VAWDELGQAMPLSVVASEDQTFAQHLGFDVKSIRASVAGLMAPMVEMDIMEVRTR
jgi:membrane peptidoglycan carboxypeptidase